LPVLGALLGLWLAGSIGQALYLTTAIGGALLFILLRAFREAGASVAAVLGAIERGANEEAEPRDLLDELRVLPRRSLLRVEGLDGPWHGPHAGEPAEALEQHG
jgi:hypothetical protein